MRARESRMKSKTTLCGVAIAARGLLTFLWGAMAMIAVPTARAAVTFPMYVSSQPNSIIQVSSTGVVNPVAPLPASSSPYGLAFDGSGNLYAADNLSDQISKISPDGLTVSTFATGISQPSFIAFSSQLPEPSSAVMLSVAASSLLLRRRRSVAHQT